MVILHHLEGQKHTTGPLNIKDSRRSGPWSQGQQALLTSKIILWRPKQKVDPKGLVLLAEEDLSAPTLRELRDFNKQQQQQQQRWRLYLWSTTGFSIG